MSPEVLVFSRDPLLLETRRLILGAFFEARGAGSIDDAEALLAMHRFDLIILCSTLSPQECDRVLELVEYQKPRPQTLFMSAPGCDSPRYATDHVLMTEPGPYQLLKRSAEILGVDLQPPGSLRFETPLSGGPIRSQTVLRTADRRLR
jgi:hypothetical protein